MPAKGSLYIRSFKQYLGWPGSDQILFIAKKHTERERQKDPSSIYSCSLSHILGNEFFCAAMFCGIPQKQMTVLLDTSDKDPLHSHCYQVNDCQKNNFVSKRRLAFLY